jgi:hypothetical protein
MKQDQKRLFSAKSVASRGSRSADDTRTELIKPQSSMQSPKVLLQKAISIVTNIFLDIIEGTEKMIANDGSLWYFD